MNDDILKGKWKEMTGDIKSRWGKLTDDDMQEAKGNGEKLRGSLQKRYGYSKEEAQREWDNFAGKTGATGASGTIKHEEVRGREAMD